MTAATHPVYFAVVFWGARFREYFLDYCLAGLLAPGNIPTLGSDPSNKFLIATRPEDWQALQEAPLFGALSNHISPEFIEIPSCPPGVSGCAHMGFGHRAVCDRAYRDQARLVIVTPDSLLSDGAVGRLLERNERGEKLIMVAALRFAEEPFFERLRKLRIITGPGQPIAAPSRAMVAAALEALHPETLRFQWDNGIFPPYLVTVPSAAWWYAPHGLLVHSLSWAPLLMDYSALGTHDLRPLEEMTLDGHYYFVNFGDQKIGIVDDSDEIFYVGWSPTAEPGEFLNTRPLLGTLGKGARFRRCFYSRTFDPLRRRAFFTPVRWHAGDYGSSWQPIEEQARTTIATFVREKNPPHWALWTAFLYVVALIETISCIGELYWSQRRRLGLRVKKLMRGEEGAAAWFSHYTKQIRSYLFGGQ